MFTYEDFLEEEEDDELFAIIPEIDIKMDDLGESEYEDLEDELFDIDF